MIISLWQVVVCVWQTPVAPFWAGIGGGLAAALGLCAVRALTSRFSAAESVEDEELAFVEEVVGKAVEPSGSLRTGTSVPPLLPSGSLPPRLDRLFAEVALGANGAESEEDQTRAWSRTEMLRCVAANAKPSALSESAPEPAHWPPQPASVRAVDVVAVRRRLQQAGRS